MTSGMVKLAQATGKAYGTRSASMETRNSQLKKPPVSKGGKAPMVKKSGRGK
jgi:hypothetical protein